MIKINSCSLEVEKWDNNFEKKQKNSKIKDFFAKIVGPSHDWPARNNKYPILIFKEKRPKAVEPAKNDDVVRSHQNQLLLFIYIYIYSKCQHITLTLEPTHQQKIVNHMKTDRSQSLFAGLNFHFDIFAFFFFPFIIPILLFLLSFLFI